MPTESESMRDLDSTFTDLQWIVEAYTLTLTALLTGGSLADRVGRRTVFLAGVDHIFTVASALCGPATSPLTLNLARGEVKQPVEA